MSSPRTESRRRPESGVENLVSWFAASVLTAAVVIYAIKRDSGAVIADTVGAAKAA